MSKFNFDEHQHLRYNPLLNEWILVSPHRTLRPWSGEVGQVAHSNIPEFDPKNPLCPGVERANGNITPEYSSVYVFTNDFPAMVEEGPTPPKNCDPLFQAASAYGTCRVMCFHPNSTKQIPTMTDKEVTTVINEWVNQMSELGRKYDWVQIFENKGAMMGCSNPHPHCQIWASSFLPNYPKIKDQTQRQYYQEYEKPMLVDYAQKELKLKERVVYENSSWLVVVPYWATWPFETMILPHRHIRRMFDLTECEKSDLAEVMKIITCKYDNIFQCTFPYSMGWHGAPTGKYLNEDMSHWTFHGVYYPPLLRSATIKKFMVGYEMLAQSQRDLTPEKAADILRKQATVHFSTINK